MKTNRVSPISPALWFTLGATLLLPLMAWSQDDKPERRSEDREREHDRREFHLEEAELDELMERARDLQEHMMRLARQGKEEAAHDLREMLQDLMREHPGISRFLEGEAGERGTLENRIHHLREAAEHLELAGFPDDAHRFHQHAEEMRRELAARERERHEARERRHPENSELRRELQELKEIVRHLQEENRDLRESVEKIRN